MAAACFVGECLVTDQQNGLLTGFGFHRGLGAWGYFRADCRVSDYGLVTFISLHRYHRKCNTLRKNMAFEVMAVPEPSRSRGTSAAGPDVCRFREAGPSGTELVSCQKEVSHPEDKPSSAPQVAIIRKRQGRAHRLGDALPLERVHGPTSLS